MDDTKTKAEAAEPAASTSTEPVATKKSGGSLIGGVFKAIFKIIVAIFTTIFLVIKTIFSSIANVLKELDFKGKITFLIIIIVILGASFYIGFKMGQINEKNKIRSSIENALGQTQNLQQILDTIK